MAFASYPIFSVYYAIMALTPMVWRIGLNLITGLIVMLANYETEINRATYGPTSADPAPFIAFIFVASRAPDLLPFAWASRMPNKMHAAGWML